MGIRLPGALERLLNDLGYMWPEVDEDNLLRLGTTWTGFASTISAHAGAADGHAQAVWTGNQGQTIEAFRTAWQSAQAPSTNLKTAEQASIAAGVGLMAAAAIVLALKINVVIQLTMLLLEILEALATAPETFGASLLEIPVFKEITGMIINAIINEAIMALMSA
jgi:hypothetical protein